MSAPLWIHGPVGRWTSGKEEKEDGSRDDCRYGRRGRISRRPSRWARRKSFRHGLPGLRGSRQAAQWAGAEAHNHCANAPRARKRATRRAGPSIHPVALVSKHDARIAYSTPPCRTGAWTPSLAGKLAPRPSRTKADPAWSAAKRQQTNTQCPMSKGRIGEQETRLESAGMRLWLKPARRTRCELWYNESVRHR